MKLKMLLTGKNGQIGNELRRCLPSLGDVVAIGRDDINLADTTAVRRLVRQLRPQLIVNAAAYTAVDQAEEERDFAGRINGELPAVLGEEASTCGAMLVHYSTDYVFDGTKDGPYQETDPPNPINAYGETKLAGERAIQRLGIPHLILRTSWVYATRGRNFLLTILRLASEKEELRVVNDQIGCPTWSRAIANGTAQILAAIFSKKCEACDLQALSGIYHITATGQTSWFGFASAILKEYSAGCAAGADLQTCIGAGPLMTRSIVPISSRDYPTPARRPANSVLANDKLLHTFHFRLPDWGTQLRLALRNADFQDLSEPMKTIT